jgi:hypothetical protein
MTKRAARGIVVSFEGVPVGQLTAFGNPGSSRELIDASAYGEEWKDFVLGQQDGDEVEGTVAYDPTDAGHADILDTYNNDPDAVTTWNLTHADAGVDFDIAARITAVNRGGALGDLLQMNFTLKIVEPGVTDNS